MTSQILAVLSKDEVISLSPSVLKFKLTISALCPFKLKSSLPYSTSHNLAVWSMEPVATSRPCGSKPKQTISILWPFSVCLIEPLLASQILAVLSKDPVTMRLPNGLLKAIVYTTFLCSSKDNSSYPLSVSHTLQVRSYEPVMNLSPALLKAQFVSGSKWALKTLNSLNFYSWFSICFSMRPTSHTKLNYCLLMMHIELMNTCCRCCNTYFLSIFWAMVSSILISVALQARFDLSICQHRS